MKTQLVNDCSIDVPCSKEKYNKIEDQNLLLYQIKNIYTHYYKVFSFSGRFFCWNKSN